ncbi:hypothetical protein JYU34_016376 [Plutella xylostella]|uniref:Adenylate kinase 7 n=1 Tax=Plutella xylostella TaxID=51655 RepID=A0ABQ7Q685_PLUXY|nr:hypothetical protein JYU34_016376 [Plutella xylostella]
MSELDVSENIFSEKRYFLNHLDSYHGEYLLKAVARAAAAAALRDKEAAGAGAEALGPEDEPFEPPPPDQPTEIIGTVSDNAIEVLPGVTRIIPRDVALRRMLTCGHVVIDISLDRGELKLAMDYMALLKTLLEKQAAAIEDVPSDAGDTTAPPAEKRYLILVSTVMTWASTKPLDPDSPDLPFVETDFRKRKPHPNYKMHYDTENAVIELARQHKKQIGAIVLTAGMTYGGKEDALFYWFQKAWECEPVLPILGRGNNVIPIINIQELAQIVNHLLTDFPKKLYILAVEQNETRQKEIVKSLAKSLGTGLFKCIPPEDGFLIPEIDQRIYDLITLNLLMEPVFIAETVGISSDATFVENLPALIKEFKKLRGLKPFKVVIHGPPLVGKTTLARRVCESYGLVYVSPETVVQDLIDDLSFRVTHWERAETDAAAAAGEDDVDDSGDDIEDEEERAEARRTLQVLEATKDMLDEDAILEYLRQMLLSRDAQNRGWVLDGFPNNLEQCAILFEKGDDEDDDNEEEQKEDEFEEDLNLYDNVLKRLLPDIVVTLEATDQFIYDKAMKQPEGDPRFEEETVVLRVKEYRAGETTEATPLNFFDELDIHPLVVKVDNCADYGMDNAYKEVALRMGSPCRYKKLLDLIEAAENKANYEFEMDRLYNDKLKNELEMKLQIERQEKMEYWTELYATLRDEEEAATAAAGEPMRNYLMSYIFPVLTPALLEVAKVRPTDPVDFLAEYLFKLNPSGKMLEPGFNLQAEKLMGKIKLLDDTIENLQIKIDPFLPEEVQYRPSSSGDNK